MINQEKIKSINTFLEKYGLKKAWANVLVKKISNSGTKYKYIYNIIVAPTQRKSTLKGSILTRRSCLSQNIRGFTQDKAHRGAERAFNEGFGAERGGKERVF